MLKKKSFFTFNTTDRIRNSENKLYKLFAKSRARSHFFSKRVINHWNALSPAARSAKDLLTFKRLIDIEISNIMYDFDD